MLPRMLNASLLSAPIWDANKIYGGNTRRQSPRDMRSASCMSSSSSSSLPISGGAPGVSAVHVPSVSGSRFSATEGCHNNNSRASGERRDGALALQLLPAQLLALESESELRRTRGPSSG